MPRFSLCAALWSAALLCGCDRSPGSGAGVGAEPSAAEVPTDMLGQPLDAEAAAQLTARAQGALAPFIPDAGSARYANLRRGAEGAVCGEVETVEGGEMYPFVVTPADTATISASPRIRFEDPGDPFPDLYMRYCATVEELRQLNERMNSLGPADVQIPATRPPILPQVGDVPADETPAPPEAEAPRRGGDDSFFNAVVRPPRG